jgi:hypothetical protein
MRFTLADLAWANPSIASRIARERKATDDEIQAAITEAGLRGVKASDEQDWLRVHYWHGIASELSLLMMREKTLATHIPRPVFDWMCGIRRKGHNLREVVVCRCGGLAVALVEGDRGKGFEPWLEKRTEDV